MKNYTTPTLKIEKFVTVDVITTSTTVVEADIQGATVAFRSEWVPAEAATAADLLSN